MAKRDYTGINAFGKIIEFADLLNKQPIHHDTRAFGPELEDEYNFVPLHGHTRGSTGIIQRASKSIFLGDALLNCSATDLNPNPVYNFPITGFQKTSMRQ